MYIWGRHTQKNVRTVAVNYQKNRLNTVIERYYRLG